MISQMLSQQSGRDEALANRLASPAEIALGLRIEETGDIALARELEAAIALRIAILHLGAALLRVGEQRQRTREITEAAHAFSAAAHALSLPPAGGGEAPFTSAKGGLFERQAFGMWARCVELLEPSSGAGSTRHQLSRLHDLGVARGVWLHPQQRPVELLQRGLRSRPFWPADELPAARALESAYAVILGELTGLRSPKAADSTRSGNGPAGVPDVSDAPDASSAASSSNGGAFSEYRSPVVTAGAWKDFQLFASCRKDAAHCALCPRTAEVIASQPRLNGMIFGSHFFSGLAEGTHLSAHCGPSNLRLRLHLGLVIPPGCTIRCGDETREWRAGECLIFDDSFEHEVWHEGDSERIVLICDLWHPDVDLQEMVLPMLEAEQREDLEAAERGEHRCLSERGYSTGERVSRQP